MIHRILYFMDNYRSLGGAANTDHINEAYWEERDSSGIKIWNQPSV